MRPERISYIIARTACYKHSVPSDEFTSGKWMKVLDSDAPTSNTEGLDKLPSGRREMYVDGRRPTSKADETKPTANDGVVCATSSS